MDNGLLNGVLFLYLKKAFDTVDHEILLKKLNFYGVDSISLKWLQSYLTDRKQRTYVNGSLSDYGSSVCGVPQGSVAYPQYQDCMLMILVSPLLLMILIYK